MLVRPEGTSDIALAAKWYETRQRGLGKEFLSEIEGTFRRIEKGPRRYRIAHKHLRRALVHRFPYAVYFAESGSDITVIAVLHQVRDRHILDVRSEFDARPGRG